MFNVYSMLKGLCVTLTLLFSQLTIAQANANDRSAQKVVQFIQEELESLKAEVKKLALFSSQEVGQKELQAQFLKCRETYKHLEFIIGYQDNFILREMNGPNLVTNPHNYTVSENKEPHGLQVIEELVYEDEIDHPQVKTEAERLLQLCDRLSKQYQLRDDPPLAFHMIIWDAIRLELIRLEALGIVGFDTPICKNSIHESVHVLGAVRDIISIYKERFKTKNKKHVFKEGIKLINNGKAYLFKHVKEQKGFNELDRLTFIRDYLHPIHGWLVRATKDIDYVLPTNLKPISSNATHLYDKSALNKRYWNTGTTDERVELGELLFKDEMFSGNEERSCASCHLPEQSFSDGLKTNVKFDGTPLKRNTPALWNVSYQSEQFWDGRVTTLEKQALSVIHNPDEMNGNLDTILVRIRSDSNYLSLFEDAYKGYISKHNIVHAINCFIGSLKVFDTPLDKYMRGDNTALTAEQKLGFNLFMGKAQCATCHFAPLFSGLVPPFYTENEAEVIGVPATSDMYELDQDSGKYKATHLDIHLFAFKTPGLRNIEHTAPYFHNGSFNTLEEVMVFYNKGGGTGIGYDVPGQTLPADPLDLSEEEIEALVAFMGALSQ